MYIVIIGRTVLKNYQLTTLPKETTDLFGNFNGLAHIDYLKQVIETKRVTKWAYCYHRVADRESHNCRESV